MPDDKPKLSRVRLAGYAAVGLGLSTIIVGIAWHKIVPDRVFWSKADANEYVEAFDAAHSASIRHDQSQPDAHMNGQGDSDDLAAARSRLAQVKQKLDRARDRRDNWGKGSSIAGAVIALLGILILRQRE
ncbi:MAG: hypothetical protein ACR2NU_15635 [Aeoliella sp.]